MLEHLATAATDPTLAAPFRKVTATKQRKYAALMATANHLQKLKILDFQPFFLFPLISALGYLNEDALKMTKWMCVVMNKSLTSARDDGIPLSVIKSRYKTEIKTAICFGLLRGHALAMHSAGRPFVSRPM